MFLRLETMQTYGLASQSFKTHKLLHIFLVANGKSKLILSFCIEFLKKKALGKSFALTYIHLRTVSQSEQKGKKGQKGIFRNIFIHTTCRLEITVDIVQVSLTLCSCFDCKSRILVVFFIARAMPLQSSCIRPFTFSPFLPKNFYIIQLSPEGEVNSGVYDAKRRGICI